MITIALALVLVVTVAAEKLPSGHVKYTEEQMLEPANHTLAFPIPRVSEIHARYLHQYLVPRKRTSRKRHWFIAFYTRWCHRCDEFVEPLTAAAEKFDGHDIKFGKVDVTQEPAAAHKYGVDAFPALVMFHRESQKVESTFEGERTVDAVAKWVEELVS
jgi:thioredoxin-like negative regulator of GroEL